MKRLMRCLVDSRHIGVTGTNIADLRDVISAPFVRMVQSAYPDAGVVASNIVLSLDGRLLQIDLLCDGLPAEYRVGDLRHIFGGGESDTDQLVAVTDIPERQAIGHAIYAELRSTIATTLANRELEQEVALCHAS